MEEKQMATKRIAARPDTYEALSQYASGLSVPLTDAIADLLAQVLEASGNLSPEDAGWRRRKLLQRQPARPGS